MNLVRATFPINLCNENLLTGEHLTRDETSETKRWRMTLCACDQNVFSEEFRWLAQRFDTNGMHNFIHRASTECLILKKGRKEEARLDCPPFAIGTLFDETFSVDSDGPLFDTYFFFIRTSIFFLSSSVGAFPALVVGFASFIFLFC